MRIDRSVIHVEKAIRRCTSVSILTLVFATLVFAQDRCDNLAGITALDNMIRENYSRLETLQTAIDAGDEFLKKYGECAGCRDFTAWLTSQLPKWRRKLGSEGPHPVSKFALFDRALQDGRYGEVYTIGAEIVQHYPDNANVLLPLAMIGLEEARKKNFKYSDDAIKYARIALDKFKSGFPVGKTNPDGKPRLDKNGKQLYGAYQYERNRDDAISELTYTLAYLTFHAKDDKKVGLAYYYEVTRIHGRFQENAELYATIGQYYFDESKPLRDRIVDLTSKQRSIQDLQQKEKIEAEIESHVALLNGFFERIASAFARAYKFADERVESDRALKLEAVKMLETCNRSSDRGLKRFVSAMMEKPFPDPSSEITPIPDTKPRTSSRIGNEVKPTAKTKPQK